VLAAGDVTVTFDGAVVLDEVSVEVGNGEIVVLLGPSGSGKSTLLRAIAGIVVPDTGRVVVDGVDVSALPTHRRRIGLVFQDEQLFAHRDVAGNIAYGLEVAKVPAPQRRRRVADLLELVGLPGFEHRRVGDLSGGEAKRVALARTLAPEPRAVLLDEPLTGLDRELHDRLAGEVAAIVRSTGTPALWVTHDLAEADAVADRIERLG
jgi:thiamine transport system ATP-binding protein